MMRTLYGYWRSTSAYRVRIALGLKSLPYESISINLRAGEQLGEAFKKINPQSLVPWLVDGEAGLGQSLAIIEYLDEVYPDPPLIPGDSIERARSEEHTSELQSLMRISYAVFCLKKNNFVTSP